MLRALGDHRSRQDDERREFGAGYAESGLVFRFEDGRPLHPSYVTQRFRRLVRLSGVERISLHGLRHTHATLMLQARVPTKVVSERLGHSDPAFTLRIYQHVLVGMQAEAAALFAGLLRDALSAQPGLPPRGPLLPG